METKLVEKKPFEVKRGMVFFLTRPAEAQQPFPCLSERIPEKKRPYIVLSNNKCCASSELINVAPIFTRDPSPDRFYNVPFKSCGNRNCVVDIANIILIPKTMCNEFTYSETITLYTIRNRNLFEGIAGAIIRQFALEEDVVSREAIETVRRYGTKNVPIPVTAENSEVKEVSETGVEEVNQDVDDRNEDVVYDNDIMIEPTTTPVQTAPVVNSQPTNTGYVPQMVIPNITLNININGVPMSFDHNNVSCESKGNQADVDVSVPPIASTKETYVEPDIRFENRNSEMSNKESAEEEVTLEPKEFSRAVIGSKDSPVRQFVTDNFIGFGGTMSARDIADKFGITKGAVYSHIKKIRDRKFHNTKVGKRTLNKNKNIQKVIDNYAYFNGNLSSSEMIELLGVSQGTFSSYVDEIVEKGLCTLNKNPETHPNKGKKYNKVYMSREDEMNLVKDYEAYGRAYVFNKYKHFGFKTREAVTRRIRTIKDRIKRQEEKTVKK